MRILVVLVLVSNLDNVVDTYDRPSAWRGARLRPVRLDSGRLRRASRFGTYLGTLTIRFVVLEGQRARLTGGSRELPIAWQFYGRIRTV